MTGPNLNRKKPSKREGSGVIPVPVREREFKPLKRNPFELRDLAMVTRR